MSGFDYAAAAELFPPKAGAHMREIGYLRFASAAEAIRFAIESLSERQLLATYLEVREHRYDHNGIRGLYRNDGYPLERRANQDSRTD
jgi:hypothetical protein